MREVRLTKAEWEALRVALDETQPDGDITSEEGVLRNVAKMTTVTLRAVPRLALASPMTEQLVALCQEAINLAGMPDAAYADFGGQTVRASLTARLAALTGGEGKDNVD